MNLTLREIKIAQQAFGYAVMYAKTEEETAEFTMLKLKIESVILKQEQDKIPEFCPVCNNKCTGATTSYKDGKITERIFFHHSSKLNNCTKKYQ